jgi:hypothetical protein
MKKLKHIADKKHNEFEKLLAVYQENRRIYKIEHNWKELPIKEWGKLAKKFFTKFFKPVRKAEKEYLKAKLNYINSLEYINGEYKTDSKKFKKLVINIDLTLKKLKEFILKTKRNKKRFKYIEISNGKDYEASTPKEFLDSFSILKIVYSKKPGNYKYKDAKALYARYYFCRGFENPKNKISVVC